MDETATERLRDSDRGWDLRESFGRSRHGTKPRLLCPSHTGAPSAPARRPGRPAGRRPVAPDQPNVPSQPPQSTPPSRARARGCPSQPPSPSHDAGPVTGPWPGPARTRPGAYRSPMGHPGRQSDLSGEGAGCRLGGAGPASTLGRAQLTRRAVEVLPQTAADGALSESDGALSEA